MKQSKQIFIGLFILGSLSVAQAVNGNDPNLADQGDQAYATPYTTGAGAPDSKKAAAVDCIPCHMSQARLSDSTNPGAGGSGNGSSPNSEKGNQ